MSNRDWSRRDLAVVWHPCTQMKDHESLPPVPIRRGQGVWLEDFDGNRYLDAISSWWVNLFGHGHPHINATLRSSSNRWSMSSWRASPTVRRWSWRSA